MSTVNLVKHLPMTHSCEILYMYINSFKMKYEYRSIVHLDMYIKKYANLHSPPYIF